MRSRKTATVSGVAAAVLVVAGGVYLFGNISMSIRVGGEANATAADSGGSAARAPGGPAAASGDPPAAPSVELADTQLAFVKVEPAVEREFPVEKGSVGSIDFDEDMTLQVFTPYQGRIIGLLAKVGDNVVKGQTLFTIDSRISCRPNRP